MKQPIEPSEIRKGDLLRAEWIGHETAEEWRTDGSPVPYKTPNVRYFLLDRPAPPVDLPTEPTWGTLRWHSVTSGNMSVFACWESNGRSVTSNLGHGIMVHSVDAFDPGIVAPTDALDQLRGFAETRALEFAKSAILTFLAAIDEANA